MHHWRNEAHELNARRRRMMTDGYRECDMPACNCGSWHRPSIQQFNRLTPAQAERLFYLLEELGEAQQAIGKILRHGYESRDPTKATPTYDDNSGGQDGWQNTSATNREALERELGDVQRAINMLCEAHDISSDAMKTVVAKGAPLKYMHHQQ